MVFCIVALIVFAIAGIFSASHRKLAKEAFRCVFRMATLRKCDTAFDQKMKIKISGKLMSKSPKISRFVFKHFSLISWILFIVTIVSLGYSIYSGYNLIVYGTCDPVSGVCLLTSTQEPIDCGSPICIAEGCDCGDIGCEAPSYEACNGNCQCESGMCST